MSASNRSAVRFVVLTVLVDAIGFGIVMPVLPGIVMKLGHVGLAASILTIFSMIQCTKIGGNSLPAGKWKGKNLHLNHEKCKCSHH